MFMAHEKLQKQDWEFEKKLPDSQRMCCVMENMLSRWEECLRKGKGHLEDVMFKKYL
jgi:hypothetical protein